MNRQRKFSKKRSPGNADVDIDISLNVILIKAFIFHPINDLVLNLSEKNQYVSSKTI